MIKTNSILGQTSQCKTCNQSFKQRLNKGGRKRKYCQNCKKNRTHPDFYNNCKCGNKKLTTSTHCKKCNQKLDRNNEIKDLRKKGILLSQIAKTYSITKERARQLCHEIKIALPKKCKYKKCQKEFTANIITKSFCSAQCQRLNQNETNYQNIPMDYCKCGDKKLITSTICKSCLHSRNITNEEIKRLYDLGYSIYKISKIAKVTSATIYQRCKNMNLNTSRYSYPKNHQQRKIINATY